MHPSSLENMWLCYRRYVEGTALASSAEVIVLDVGGADVNGTYRDIFRGPQFLYLAVDLVLTNGVGIVVDSYHLPLGDASVEIVICGQMLEQCEFFWLAFSEMVRVVKPDGYVFLIAPSAGPEHRYPVDCYRFYPDAYRALAKYANCNLIDVWCDQRGPWNDLVGVFRHDRLPEVRESETSNGLAVAQLAPAFLGTPEEELTRGEVPYLDVLAELHRQLEPALYVEIGVRHGNSLSLARCDAIGVDPRPELRGELPATARLATMTSDDFFAGVYRDWVSGVPDLVFIDGMHLFEFALRDFMHIERISSPGTLVVFDDVFPNCAAQAARRRRTRAWTGDVWKIQECLREHRPELFLLQIDTVPAGMLLVAGLDAANRVLWNEYNPIVRHFSMDMENAEPPRHVVQRHGCISWDAAVAGEICKVLRKCRSGHCTAGDVVALLRHAVPSSDSR
jgi:hypothetical protein